MPAYTERTDDQVIRACHLRNLCDIITNTVWGNTSFRNSRQYIKITLCHAPALSLALLVINPTELTETRIANTPHEVLFVESTLVSPQFTLGQLDDAILDCVTALFDQIPDAPIPYSVSTCAYTYLLNV